jgi:EpsI family protein
MPKTIGPWVGDDVHLEPRVFEAIGGQMAISRLYKMENTEISLHCAVFTKAFMQYNVRRLHPPEVCYPGNGYTIENEETVQFEPARETIHLARLLTMSRDGHRVFCLYWYQVGTTTFWSAVDQRRIVDSFRGRTVWPPMIKVMLQTSANSPEEATTTLKSLAALVYPWTRDFH